jgi:NAD(P)-dependent dehydrogenase (short-subunit alcohol dehydrogenase family)
MNSRPTAFVTGASRGVGRGISLELARCGFDIVGNATRLEVQDRQAGLREVQQRVEELGANFEPAPGDIADLSTHEHLLSVALERFGRVDVLVNNAGIAPRQRRDILETTPESFDQVLAVNTRGTFFLTQRFARQMVKQPPGESPLTPTVVFVSSISASVSSPSRAEYCISKAAISQAAAVFADRLAEFGINVYEVRPGIVETDMTAPVREQYDARIAQGLVPQKRWGQPQDVGRAVAALARGDFAYATGLVVEISGGMNIRRL